MAMRFRAHDTFFIRKGWLSKGMKHIVEKPGLFVDKTENPMDVLGIGANMVKSLRYWLQTVGLTEEPKSGKRDQTLTDLGKEIYKYDCFIEELGTLYLLHYKLATNKADASAWYHFFNVFSMSEFTREDFVKEIQKYIKIEGEADVALRSLNDDFNCIINTYLPRYKTNTKRVSPENNIDCPLGEIGLVDILNKDKKTYKKTTPPVSSFNPWVVYAVIMDNAAGRTEIGLNELLTAERNIGKVFNLDAIAMIDILHRVEKIGLLKIIRTAGLDVIQINKTMSFMECVKAYYKNIEEV